MQKAYYRIEINPEPWIVPPFSKGGAGKDQRGAVYKDAIKESLEAMGALVLDPPYRIHFIFSRRLEQYATASGRRMTRRRVDATNMQKLTEDALQGVLIVNDVDTEFISSHRVAQSRTAPMFVEIMVIGQFEPWGDLRPAEFKYDKPIELATPPPFDPGTFNAY